MFIKSRAGKREHFVIQKSDPARLFARNSYFSNSYFSNVILVLVVTYVSTL